MGQVGGQITLFLIRVDYLDLTRSVVVDAALLRRVLMHDVFARCNNFYRFTELKLVIEAENS